jgi:hypothetical protein
MAYLNLIETEFFGRPWVYAEVSEQLIIMLPITQDGRYVAISQSRPTFAKRVISPVMGTFHETDPNKMFEIAAKEIKSETGHKCIKVKYIMTVARSSGLTDETAHVYFAIVENHAGKQELHPEEDINVLYFSSHEELILTMQNTEQVIDSSFPLYLINNTEFKINENTNIR